MEKNNWFFFNGTMLDLGKVYYITKENTYLCFYTPQGQGTKIPFSTNEDMNAAYKQIEDYLRN